MEDIQLTPDNYKLPVLHRNQDIYFTVGKRLFMEVHVYFQIVSIETDMDIIGLEQFQNFKVEKYLRYDSQVQMTNFIENDIYETGESFCSVTIKLSDLVRVQRRSYSNLLSVLESVGGTMEVIFLLFKISSYFITAILYELDIVNILFKFNIDKKTIIIKNNKNNFESKYKIVNKSGSTKVFPTYNKKIDNFLIPFNDKKRISSSDQMCIKSYRFSKFQITPKDEPVTAIRLKKNNKDKEKDNNNSQNIIIRETPEENNISIFDYKKERKNLISKIKFKEISYYFCIHCFKKKKKYYYLLLNESMKLFIEKMDITYIFKKIVDDDENINSDEKSIEMPEEIKSQLTIIQNDSLS
jgi:hypothetical protein